MGGLGFAAALVGGAVGSIASQVVGNALGVQDGFSWGQVALGAIGAGIGAGVGHFASNGGGLLQHLKGPGFGATVGRATVGNIGSQAVAVATGLQEKFSWKQVGASAVGAGLSWGVTEIVGNLQHGDAWNVAKDSSNTGYQAAADKIAGNTFNKIVRGTAAGLVAGGAQAALTGEKPNWGLIAANSFGSSLGNSIAEGAARADEERVEVDKAEESAGGGSAAGQGERPVKGNGSGAVESAPAPVVKGDGEAALIMAVEATSDSVNPPRQGSVRADNVPRETGEENYRKLLSIEVGLDKRNGKRAINAEGKVLIRDGTVVEYDAEDSSKFLDDNLNFGYVDNDGSFVPFSTWTYKTGDNSQLDVGLKVTSDGSFKVWEVEAVKDFKGKSIGSEITLFGAEGNLDVSHYRFSTNVDGSGPVTSTVETSSRLTGQIKAVVKTDEHGIPTEMITQMKAQAILADVDISSTGQVDTFSGILRTDFDLGGSFILGVGADRKNTVNLRTGVSKTETDYLKGVDVDDVRFNVDFSVNKEMLRRVFDMPEVPRSQDPNFHLTRRGYRK